MFCVTIELSTNLEGLSLSLDRWNNSRILIGERPKVLPVSRLWSTGNTIYSRHYVTQMLRHTLAHALQIRS